MKATPDRKPDYWVFAEQRRQVVHNASYELIGAAAQIASETGGSVTAVLLGHGIGDLAPELILHGANRVLVVDDERLALYRLMPYASVLKRLCLDQDPDVFLFGATSLGVELAPRVAAILDTGLSAHCIDLTVDAEGRLLQVVPGWGGGVLATIACTGSRPAMATVIPGVFRPDRQPQRTGEIVRLEAGDDVDLAGPRVVGVEMEPPRGTSIGQADVIVAGGWGIGNRENWKLLDELAGHLCGAVGATRPPVDEGWAAEEQMIGQSGRVVKPRVYIGVGISGMMHHVVGMDGSGYVIVINKDEKAPFLEAADLALVGDFRKILPPLLKSLGETQAGECKKKIL